MERHSKTINAKEIKMNPFAARTAQVTLRVAA